MPAPLIDPHGAFERLTEEEVELRAPFEHKRWEEDQQADGWKRTDGAKDARKKLHPKIGVDWNDLSESEKDKDRAHVREIPDVLALAGFQIVRLGLQEGKPSPRRSGLAGREASVPAGQLSS